MHRIAASSTLSLLLIPLGVVVIEGCGGSVSPSQPSDGGGDPNDGGVDLDAPAVVPCEGGLTSCCGACVDTSNDVHNCGCGFRKL